MVVPLFVQDGPPNSSEKAIKKFKDLRTCTKHRNCYFHCKEHTDLMPSTSSYQGYCPRLQAAIHYDRRLESRLEITRRWIPHGRIHCKLDGNRAELAAITGSRTKIFQDLPCYNGDQHVKRHYMYVTCQLQHNNYVLTRTCLRIAHDSLF